jgi:hypothetical protein
MRAKTLDVSWSRYVEKASASAPISLAAALFLVNELIYHYSQSNYGHLQVHNL